MRRRDVLDPAARRELDALDAALAGEPVEPDLEGLAVLARDVRAVRPEVDVEFAARLDEWAASGFQAGSSPGARPRRAGRGARVASLAAGARGWLRARTGRRALLPALGAAASVLVALVVAASLLSGGDGTHSGPAPVGAPAEGAAEPGAGAVPDATSPSTRALPVPPPDGDPLAPGRPRRVERQAALVLAAPADRVSELGDRVIRTTDEVGGIVSSSSVSSGDDGRVGAWFQLRVPTRRLDEALARLSRLGHVRSRTQSSQDVTGSFVTARERLDEALAERRSLLRRLARAQSANEAESIRARLAIVRAEISSARAQLRRLGARTSYASVSVTVEARDESGAAGPWTPADAIRDAVRVLEVFAAVAVVALAVLGPLALLLGAGLLGGRALRRRRREQALSAG